MIANLNFMEISGIVFEINKNKIIKMYENGISIEKIKENYNLGSTILSKKLRENGIKIEDKKVSKIIEIWEKNKDKIIEEYNHGITIKQICKKYGLGKKIITKRLKKNGIPVFNRKHRVWRNNKNEIIKDYQSGMTLRQLQKKYNISDTAIRENLQKNGMEVRDKSLGKVFVKFDKIDDLFYILGVLEADGSVFCYDHHQCKNSKFCVIQLDCKDLDFAQAFENSCKKIGLKPRLSKHPKSCFKQGFCWRVHCNSKVFYDWYQKLDLNSILNEKMEFKIAFIRGLFDSDGCSYMHPREYKRSVKITTTKKHFADFVKKMIESIDFRCTIYGGTIMTGFCKERYDATIMGGNKECERFLKLINPNIARKKYGGN